MTQATTGDDQAPTRLPRVMRRDEPLSPAGQAALDRSTPEQLEERIARANRR